MRNLGVVLAALFCVNFLFAQEPFEGTITVTYKNEKQQAIVAEVKIKGDRAYIKQTQNGNRKYGHFIVDLVSKDFYTVSVPDKKVVIKYNMDKLLEYFEKNNLKEGYKRNYNLGFKTIDKVKDEGGLRLVKTTGENESVKVIAWITDLQTPLTQLIPLLRLLGNWNEVQGTAQTIIEADASSKLVKKETSVRVALKRENISKDLFEIPKEYLLKDFAQLMEEEKNNKDLKGIVQTFTEF